MPSRIATAFPEGPHDISHSTVAGVEIIAKPGGRHAEILNAEALAFLADLHRRFDAAAARVARARAWSARRLFDAGELPDFLPETTPIRDGDWRVAPIPADLLDRRVEITGPVDRKMIVNALNSGAKVFMADFEDANSPMFANIVEGQINLKDRWAGKIDFTDPATGKAYALGQAGGAHGPPARLASAGAACHCRRRGNVRLAVRFRPLFLPQRQGADAAGATPAFYLPKLESHLEARLWNEFSFTRRRSSASRRDDQGDGADRDAARRLRDGRDPL